MYGSNTSHSLGERRRVFLLVKKWLLLFLGIHYSISSRPGSVVGIATGYGLDGRGSNPGGDEIFRTCPDRLSGPPSLLYNGCRVFPGGKERPGRDADPLTPSSAVVMKG